MADLLVSLSALLLAAAPQAADRCVAGACVSSPTSLDLSAVHGPGGSSAPASSLDVESWSWGASNSGHARDAGSGMASGKRMGRGKVSVSDISMTKRSAPSSSSSSPSASVSSVSSLAGGAGGGAAAASYARLAPPACSSSSACPGTVSVQLARKGWDGCVKGSHIASAHLRGASSSIHLTDVTVQDCDDASGRMTLSYASVSEAPSKPGTR